MARALIPFVIAPLLALAIIAAVGEGAAAAILGLAGAGILGGAGAWLAFGSSHGGRRGVHHADHALGPTVNGHANTATFDHAHIRDVRTAAAASVRLEIREPLHLTS